VSVRATRSTTGVKNTASTARSLGLTVQAVGVRS
jgi:hypothetical protein